MADEQTKVFDPKSCALSLRRLMEEKVSIASPSNQQTKKIL